jgi:flagellar biosynthetic protein FliR
VTDFGTFVEQSQLFFLIFARIFALLAVAPLMNSGSIPNIARVSLALLVSFLVFPGVLDGGYPIPQQGLQYVLLILGEALIGIITGFFLVLVFAIFQLAGQLFSLQMGFGASQVFDPLSQIQIPLVGQFLNIIAMLIFVTVSGFQQLFMIGVSRSFEAVRAVDLVLIREDIAWAILTRLTRLFEHAMVIAFPILGTLFLIYVAMGLLGKAAPQMNLLILGFPISIFVAFLILFLAMPIMAEAFERVIDEGFEVILRFYRAAQEASG